MDFTALRVRRIDQRLEAARFAIELRARRHLAVFAVALTLGGGAAYSGLSGQVDPFIAGTAAGGTALAVVLQVRAMGRLAREWEREARATDDAMETLMLSQENDRHDV